MTNDKTHPITIRISSEMLNQIDSRIPDRRRVCRERFVLDAVEAYLARALAAEHRGVPVKMQPSHPTKHPHHSRNVNN
jgi:metal-responsive CopG/Arc/MetJ family transcriptional regulator